MLSQKYYAMTDYANKTVVANFNSVCTRKFTYWSKIYQNRQIENFKDVKSDS